MQKIDLDQKWIFRRGFLDSLGMLETVPGVEVDLPHDGMIGTAVDQDAIANYDWGYFKGDRGNYTKYVFIPEEWKEESIGLRFDGAMMNVSVDVNGYPVGTHHYGYSPFYVDISKYVTFAAENRVTVHYNNGTEPSCRWYPGAGLYRSVELCHGPKVHIANDGIYLVTKEIGEGVAFLEAQIAVCNETDDNRLVEIAIELTPENADEVAARVKRLIQVNARETGLARQTILLPNPKLWDAENPNLYEVKVSATDTGVYRTHFISNAESGRESTVDTATTLFGVRTITVDALRGLRINGKTVKLKGGCMHHDNGLLGAVSLYQSEVRKVQKLKEVGYNAIRTSHNPPSSALIEACDRLGMYIMDEAFDAWGMPKRIGDFSNFFPYEWETELSAYIRRDRMHPAVIMWSIGNEIPERGGLQNGYDLASRLAEKVRELDPTRPICNGICSYWSGLDDYLSKGMDHTQNAVEDPNTYSWEKRSEPFTNGLDVVGYNYLEDHYENDHACYPERVMVGSETFPQEIGFRWPMVEKLPYVIGDFTWTAWDYIGEAGIGKALYLEEDDPLVQRGPWGVMPPQTTVYPWRLANDADFDITGRILPQGTYRSIVWGSSSTFVYTLHPDTFGKTEVMSMWGFPALYKSWNYQGYEEKTIELVVFSSADEVALFINEKLIEKKAVNKMRPPHAGQPLVNSVMFQTIYVPGKVEVISYRNGEEISRDMLQTTKAVSRIQLVPERKELTADGHDVWYVGIDLVDEDGNVVPDAEVALCAQVSGCGYLAGFGTGNPITEEDYTDAETVTYQGHAMAVVRVKGKDAGAQAAGAQDAGAQAVDVQDADTSDFSNFCGEITLTVKELAGDLAAISVSARVSL